MDATKLRLFAAVAGIVSGFGGMLALSVAGVLALSSVIGLIAACFTGNPPRRLMIWKRRQRTPWQIFHSTP